MATEAKSDKLQRVKDTMQTFPDFPKPGINFKDLFPVLRTPDVFADLIEILVDHVKQLGNVDVIVGLESRGFLLAPIIGLQLKIPFVPIRKKGKLPGELIRVEFELEYGKDVFEAQKNSIKPGDNVVIVDDLLATGGTMAAAEKLVKQMQGKIVQSVCVVELVDLKGRDKLISSFQSFIKF